MSEQILPGEGYRLIDKAKDTKRPGDEYWSCFGKWALASNDGMFHTEHVYRRRIPAKPEAMEIDDPCGKMSVNVRDDGSALVEQEWPGDHSDFVAIDTVDSIRKLSQWFAQVAEWREAQNAGK